MLRLDTRVWFCLLDGILLFWKECMTLKWIQVRKKSNKTNTFRFYTKQTWPKSITHHSEEKGTSHVLASRSACCPSCHTRWHCWHLGEQTGSWLKSYARMCFLICEAIPGVPKSLPNDQFWMLRYDQATGPSEASSILGHDQVWKYMEIMITS